MNKTKMHIVSILTIGLFIAIMTSGGLLKKPFGETDNVLECIETLKTDISNENWEKSQSDLKALKSAWQIVEKRVQFSVERDEMLAIGTSIARIEGTLLSEDKSAAIIEISEFIEHWNELEK